MENNAPTRINLRLPMGVSDSDLPIARRAFGEFAEVEPLLALCAGGKLYEVEIWISEGRPLQFPPSDDRKMKRRSTALQIAVSSRFHSLAGLLLANGYDPNGDYHENLSPAVRAKDRDMVNLLLRFGADPGAIDFCDVLETCDRVLMDRFVVAGIDPCRENAVARALSFKGRPILGFIKQYRDRFPGLQRQIDIALHGFTDREDLRGIALMLWLGADPHANTPSSAYEEDDDNGGWDSAFERALWAKSPVILPQFLKRPIPREKVQPLLVSSSHNTRPELVKRLLAEGADPNFVEEEGEPVLRTFISRLLWRYSSRSADEVQCGFEALDILLQAGAKWMPTVQQLKWLRRDLAGGESRIVVRLVDVFKRYRVFSEADLHELTRTPAVKKVLSGISKPRKDPWGISYSPQPIPVAPPVEQRRRPFWRRHGSQW